jgi:hypothetical protein
MKGLPLHQLILVGFMFCSALAFATTDPIQSGYAAFEKKQWRDAYEYWVPEADKGDARAQFYLSILFSKVWVWSRVKRLP